MAGTTAASPAMWAPTDSTFGGHDHQYTSAADGHRAAEPKCSKWWPRYPGMRGHRINPQGQRGYLRAWQ